LGVSLDYQVVMSGLTEAPTPDAALVLAIRDERSDHAFSVLYDRHTPAAFQTAWRILGGRTNAAEDVVQDAWIRAIESLDRWRGSGPFGAWLRGITAHVAIDAVRSELRFTDEALDETTGDDTSADRLDLEAAIAGLPPGYRTVLVLHDVEGFTHEEIASRLGITAGTSKTQLFRARRAVRARIALPTEGRT
jgi:RNA polymerase sigma-70 factor, ECF subfamily